MSCYMEQSTGSSTSKRGAMTREIGRNYFRGIVIPGLMLKNRNLQAEWMPRLEIDAKKNGTKVEGQVAVMNGAVPHNFPDGDPVLKQFFLTVTVKDKKGRDRRPENCAARRSEEHTSELQSPCNIVCRLLLEKKKISNKAGKSNRNKGVLHDLHPNPHSLRQLIHSPRCAYIIDQRDRLHCPVEPPITTP